VKRWRISLGLFLTLVCAAAPAYGHGTGLPNAAELTEGLAPSPALGERLDAALGQSHAPSPCETATSGPSSALLLGTGVALSPLVYELAVLWHEGSHVTSVLLVGGNVVGFNPFPTEYQGHIRYGQTSWNGVAPGARTALVAISPKITDAMILGGYALTLETGSLPQNKWEQLALAALAVGALIDFGKDFAQSWAPGDIPMFYRNAGITNTTPFRLLHLGLTGAAAVEVARGTKQLFTPEPTPVTPPKSPPAAFDLKAKPYVSAEHLGIEGTF
jgi:hypothetical protein